MADPLNGRLENLDRKAAVQSQVSIVPAVNQLKMIAGPDRAVQAGRSDQAGSSSRVITQSFR